MRTVKEIKRKIKDLRYRYLQKKYKRLLSRKPENCRFNFRQPLKGGETIGLCIPEDFQEINEVVWQGTICEDLNDAKNCKYFCLKYNKKMLAKQLDSELSIEEVCKEKYKDIAALYWVLNGKIKKSFFKRLLQLFRKSKEDQNE